MPEDRNFGWNLTLSHRTYAEDRLTGPKMVPTIFSTPPEFNIASEKGPFVKRKVVKSSKRHSSVGYTPPKTSECPLKIVKIGHTSTPTQTIHLQGKW